MPILAALDAPASPQQRIARVAARYELNRRAKARSSLAEFYRICEPDYILGDWLSDLIHHLEWVEATPNAKLMVFAPPRHGKALAKGTEIPTLRGMEKIENLKAGDFVLGSTGKPIRVVGVKHWKNRPRYRVTTDDGCEIIVDGAHEWLVRLDRKHKAWTVRETQWLAARSSPRKPLIPMAQVQGKEIKLPIDPYTLGTWLGDGSRNTGNVSKDKPDQAHFRARIEKAGYKTTDLAGGRRFGILQLSCHLKTLGVDPDKHIPEIYFHASVAQRTALLQGLIDTDGYVANHGQIEYCSVDEKLARGAARLIHSLGVKASLCTGRAMLNGVDHGPKYRVMFYMKDAASLPRKAKKTFDGTKQPGRYLSFERVADGDTTCIEVEAEDHLYLATDAYIVTHNSQTVSRILPTWLLGRHPRAEIMLTASTQDLADEFGRYVRGKLNDPVIQEIFPKLSINPSANAVDKIVLNEGGGIRAVGVGGQIVGRGADYLVIDDPYKNRAQAYSASEREKLFNWYRTDARTRLAPNGKIILMHQRWHIDDLASQLRKLADADDMADQWRVVVYPALCEDPETDPLFRQKDEPLDPVRWPIAQLYPLRANANEMEWLALYQQRPVKEEGGFFKADYIQYHSGMPEKLNIYIGWDGAASLSTTANKSALMPIGFNPQGDSYLGNDYVLAKIDSLEACDKVLDLVVKYRKAGHTVMGICVEKGMFNSVIKPIFNMRCRERQVYVSTIEISRAVGKHIIAAPLQARMQQKKVFFPDNKQTRAELIPQFLNFIPDADNDEDDGIDGMANVFMAIDHLAIPMPAPQVPELSDAELEALHWKKIMRTGDLPRNERPWGRLNGDQVKTRT